MPYVAPSTVTTLQTYTSAAHNVIVGDVIDHETRIANSEAAWTDFTPQLRQGSTNIASTRTFAKYRTVGKTLWAIARVVSTGTGTSGPVKLSLPSGFTLALTTTTTTIIGSAIFGDLGVNFVGGMAIYNEDPYVQLIQGGGADFITTVVAVGDSIAYNICVPLA